MKTVISFLLVILAIEIHGSVIRERRQYQMDQIKFINDFNSNRRLVANQANVSDMWKIEWSQELVEKAFTMKDDHCLAIRPSFNYRFFYHEGNEDALKYEVNWLTWFQNRAAIFGEKDPLIEKEQKGMLERTGYILERVHPLQSKVGCIPMNCEFDIKMENLTPVVTYHLKYRYLCLIGPNGQFPTGVHNGPPASACGSGGHNEDGLCVAN
uniref:SCP domain-containing protein n=1 Tax=Caenorhabditis tropicalis TaxID=1561998 RepID=A0A1I7T9W5_9PELO